MSRITEEREVKINEDKMVAASIVSKAYAPLSREGLRVEDFMRLLHDGWRKSISEVVWAGLGSEGVTVAIEAFVILSAESAQNVANNGWADAAFNIMSDCTEAIRSALTEHGLDFGELAADLCRVWEDE